MGRGNKDILGNFSTLGDEYYTLPQHVHDIAEQLIPISGKVWCPFDEDWSQFPIVLRELGYDVVNTSTDFFTTDPPEGVSCIISNPPFSKKKEVMKRIRDLQLPFVLILPQMWMNDGVPFDYGQQLILWRKRVRFRDPEGNCKWPRSTCFVLSNGLLKSDLKIYTADRR